MTKTIVSAVQAVLSPDLLKPEWRRIARRRRCRVTGHCYAASEAIYHLVGGAAAGWVPQVLSHRTWPEGLKKGRTHWFIRNKRTGAVIDATSAQFSPLVPRYEAGVGSGFLTRSPSRRAVEIISRLAS